MHAELNSVVLFTILYWRFQHCAKDVLKVTAQCTILEFRLMVSSMHVLRVSHQETAPRAHTKFYACFTFTSVVALSLVNIQLLL